MLIALKSIKTAIILATDGDIGHVDQFLFDDDKWLVRYIVVKTHWLSGKKVLVPPSAVKSVDVDLNSIQLSLTKKKVEESPDVDTDRPISSQMETRYIDYYQLPYYSLGSDIWGMSERPTSMLGQPHPVPPRQREVAPYFSEEDGDPHLRSAHVVEGYRIDSQGDLFGRVDDFIINREDWKICSLVIDLHRLWPGKSVLISPHQVASIRWSDRTVGVNLTQDQIKNLPEYNWDLPLDWAEGA